MKIDPPRDSLKILLLDDFYKSRHCLFRMQVLNKSLVNLHQLVECQCIEPHSIIHIPTVFVRLVSVLKVKTF